MATHEEIRAVAKRLEGSVEGEERFGFSVIVGGKAKGYCWSWLERIDPKKARVVNDSVLAVLVPNLEIKEALLAADPVALFTEPHYNGYPAVLVRLESMSIADLAPLLEQAWLAARKPKRR